MSWWRTSYQDRLKTASLERLDRPDFDSVSELGGYAAARLMGAVFGECTGSLSNIVTRPANSGDLTQWWLYIGAFEFIWGYKERGDNNQDLRDSGRLLSANPYGDGAQKGYVSLKLTHDPSRAGQSAYSQIDVTGLITAAREDWFVTNSGEAFSLYDSAAAKQIWPFLWARPVLVDAQTGSRRQWNAGSGTEQAVNIPTRTEVLIEFILSYADPTPSDGSEPPWAKVGRILDYADGSTWNLDAYGSGPQVPLLRAVSVFDNDNVSRTVKQPGTPTYTGSAVAAAAEGPNGTITAFGQSQDGTQPQYGQAPILANTIGVSEFFSPDARWGTSGYPDQGILFGAANNTPPNSNAPQAPIFMGVAEMLALIRDRIRRLVLGRDGSSVTENNTPWWFVPRYGINALCSTVDTLDSRVEALEPYLARPIPVASAFVEWNPATSSYALTKLHNCAFTRNGNNVDAVGETEPIITFTPELAGVRIGWVEVCVLPNKGGTMSPYTYQWGADTFGNGYDPAKGGYQAKIKRIWDSTTPNGSAAQQEVHLRLEGPEHDEPWPAEMVTVTGSFMLTAYADPSWTPPA